MMTAPSSRATRRLGSEASATSVRDSRVKTSTIARMRNRRPSANASDRKPGLQRWLGLAGVPKDGGCFQIKIEQARYRREKDLKVFATAGDTLRGRSR